MNRYETTLWMTVYGAGYLSLHHVCGYLNMSW